MQSVSFEGYVASGQPSWEEVNACAVVYGDSFYLFDESVFRRNFESLGKAFQSRYPSARIAYSYKTNYTPAICRIVEEMGGYAEVVSEMEFDLARSIGAGQIIYNGPYKSPSSVRTALLSGAIVNLDSVRDYKSAVAVAEEFPDRKFSVGLRCNFAIASNSTSRFGFDVDGEEFRQVVDALRGSRNLSLSGLHSHFPNRDIASFKDRIEKMLELSKRLFPEGPQFLDIGGGFFGEMPESLRQKYEIAPPTFEDYAEAICEPMRKAYPDASSAPALYVEPGTALVANTFRFYTKVIDTKMIRGRGIATVAGSIMNVSPHSRLSTLPVSVVGQQANGAAGHTPGQYDIAGNTCIENDFLSKGIEGHLQVGDFLEYRNLGSYSVVMKPPFIHPNVAILSIGSDGTGLKLIKRAEALENLFDTFV